MTLLSASDLKIASDVFPGYTAKGQETSTGLITLNKLPEAPQTPAAQNPDAKPLSLSPERAQTAVLKAIAQHGDEKKGGLKERANSWFKTGPRLARFYQQPAFRKYAALDGSARQAQRLIEEAKRNPALLKRIDPQGALRQALNRDAPRPGRTPRNYKILEQTHHLLSNSAATKAISLKQLPFLPQKAATLMKTAMRPLMGPVPTALARLAF